MRSGDRYLYLSRHNVFYFRVIVHVTEKGCNVKKEYRKSLQTRSPQVARRFGRAMRWSFEEHCFAREVNIVEWEKVKEILDEKLLKLIAEEKEQIRKKGPCTIGVENELKAATLPYLKKLLERFSWEKMRGESIQDIELPQFIEEAVNDAFKDCESPFPDDEQYLRVCEAVLQMLIAFSEERIVLNNDARSFKLNEQESPSVIATSQHPISQAKGHSLKAVIAEFCEERIRGGNWTEKTVQEHQAQYELFIEIVNERPIESISAEDARYFRKSLQQLPTHRKKKPLYRDKTVNELLGMDIPKAHLLSITKVNQHLTRVSSFFGWAQDMGYVANNHFHGMKVKEKVSDEDKRDPFDNEDLEKIFSTSIFQEGKFRHPYYYWLPLIGLYTGARIEELCQLYLADIYEENGIAVARIATLEEGQKIKTSASRRVVPIHSRLIELGVLEYVEYLRKKKKERLFPELNKKRDGYSHNASKWFGRYKTRLGFPHYTKVFHSFRHTVIDYLKQQHVEESLIKAVVGHKDFSITTGLYGSKYKPESLKPIVERLDFPVEVNRYFDLVK